METRNCSESIVGTRVPTEVFEDMKEEIQCNNIFILFDTDTGIENILGQRSRDANQQYMYTLQRKILQ